MENSIATVVDSVFENNFLDVGSAGGGAVYAQDGAVLDVSWSRFRNNHANTCKSHH